MELTEGTPTPGVAGKLAKPAAVLFTLFGVLFCVQWLLGTLIFPMYKGRLIGYAPVLLGALLGMLLCNERVRGSLNRRINSLSRGQFLFWVIALTLGLRALAILFFPVEPTNDHSFFHRYAIHILEGKGYGGIRWGNLQQHLGPKSDLRAFFPPGMTFLLVGGYAVAGPSPLAGKALVTLLSVALAVLVYDVGRRGASEAVGRWAALLTACCPTLVFYSATLGYETALAVVLAAVTDLALLAPARPRAWHVAAAGLLLGAGALLKPVCLFVPGLLLVWWLLAGAGWRAPLYAAACAVCIALVVAPWTWRNYLVLDAFVPISTNGGYVLWSANNPLSTGIHMDAEPLEGETDEVTMDRIRSRAAREWIVANPLAFARLAAIKSMITWGTSSTIMSYISNDRMVAWQEAASMAVLNVAWTALLVICLFATWRGAWGHPAFLIPWLLLAYFFALHLVFEAHSRHQIPVVWILLLLAAWGLAGQRPAARTSVLN